MSKKVWWEWQARWRDDPWGEERADLRSAINTEAITRYLMVAMSYIVSSNGAKDFEYPFEAMPGVRDYMPYRDPSAVRAERETYVEDHTPLDPNTMTERDLADMDAYIAQQTAIWQAAYGVAQP